LFRRETGVNRKYHHFMIALYLLTDALMVIAAWGLAYLLRFSFRLDLGLGAFPEDPATKTEYVFLLPAVVILQLFLMGHFSLYRMDRAPSLVADFFGTVKSTIVGWLLLLAVLYLTHLFGVSRYVLASFLVICPILLLFSRGVARLVQDALRNRGRGFQRAIIVGAGKLGQELHEKIRKNDWLGITVVSYIDDRENRLGKVIAGVPVQPFDSIKKIISAHGVEQVCIALPSEAQESHRDVIAALADEVVDVRLALDVNTCGSLNASVSDFCGLPMLNLRESPLHGWNALLKRVFDVVVAGSALLVFGIPMLVFALVIKLTSRGPVFYRQERMGLDGRSFNILKFRTMGVDAEKETGAVWAKENDPRRTRFGVFLRKTSLDELPQFINALLGHMSVVGPRPERPVFISEFKKQIPRYMLRHKAKAGITGWAQVNGWRGNTSLSKRIQYDLYYVENWSIWFDAKILFMTFLRGFVGKSAY